jgi:hypothetical protein
VINPGGLYIPEWDQDKYMAFWVGVIRQQVATLVFPPETIYSTGGRVELSLALQLQMPVVDMQLKPLRAVDLWHHDGVVRGQMERYWSPEQVEAYMPYVDFQKLVPYEQEADPAALDQFTRLAAEHNIRSQGHQSDK